MIKRWVYDEALIIRYNTYSERMWHLVYDFNREVKYIFQTVGITYTRMNLFCSNDFDVIKKKIELLKLNWDNNSNIIKDLQKKILIDGFCLNELKMINSKDKFITLLRNGVTITV